MKRLKILSFVFLVISLLCVFEYINLMSLYKDQVDWGTTTVELNDKLTKDQKTIQLKEIAAISTQINNAKKYTVILFIVSVIGMIACVVMLNNKKQAFK